MDGLQFQAPEVSGLELLVDMLEESDALPEFFSRYFIRARILICNNTELSSAATSSGCLERGGAAWCAAALRSAALQAANL